MKKITCILLSFFIFILNINAVSLNTESLEAMDINSKRVLYKKNENEVRLIASTTKIMTAILAIESNKLEDVVEAKEEVLTMYGSNIYIEYHEHMLLLDLIYGLMLRSGNDAAVVIANYIGGTEENFVKMMNDKAKELGMTNTTYQNPHGLDENTQNYSTAHDLNILYSYAYKNKIFKDIVGTKTYKTASDKKTYLWKNRNKILSIYDKANGGKTGYTPSAKKVLVTSAQNKDLDIVISSFNSIYDYDLQKQIYEEIFMNYTNTLILDKNNFKPKNNPFRTKLYIKKSFSYPLTEEEQSKITKKIKYYDENKVKNKKVVGKIYVYLNNELINTTDIYQKVKTKNNKFFSIFQ